MRRLFSLVRSVSPFLFAERGSLALTRALKSAGLRGQNDPAARSFNEDDEQRGLLLRGQHENLDLPDRRLANCDFEGVNIQGMDFTRGHWSRSVGRTSQLKDVHADKSSWDVVDLEGAQLRSLSAQDAHFSLVSFRDALLSDSSLDKARLCLCDFSGATLQQVSMRGARLSGCDFEGAILEQTILTGADLSGCVFRNAWCGDLELDGARTEGADFRGAVGLSSTLKKSLVERGARVGGGWTYGLFARVFGRGGGVHHRRVLRAMSVAWAFLALTIPIAFFVRAILNPIDPEEPPGFNHHEAPVGDLDNSE